MAAHSDTDTVSSVASFHANHGRWPSPASPDATEQRLGTWLTSQRVHAAQGLMDVFRRAYLDEALPGWNLTAEEIWLERAREVSNFLLRHGALPNFESDHLPERRIGVWLSMQRTMYRSGGLSKPRSRWLDQHCPGWDGRVRVH